MNTNEAFSAAAQAASCEQCVLPSGLTVVVRPMADYSSAHVIFGTKFGSINSKFKLGGEEITLPAGVAHFLEHKMFENEDGDAFALYAKTGANANAYTSFDRTCYLFTATSMMDESLNVLLGMVSNPYFTKETIAKEQGIIGQEIKMYDDSPDWRLITGLCESMYAEHPIKNDIAGSCESIAEITPEMLYSCCRGYYSPANMVLAAAGNITMEQLTEACKRNGLYEARGTNEKAQSVFEEEPENVCRAFHTETMPVSQPCFGIGFKEKPLDERDASNELLYNILCDVICGSMSPLYRKLYDENLINPGFDGELLRVAGCCCFLFTGVSSNPELVQKLLLEEIERIRKEGVDRETFRLCKNQKYGSLIESLENADDAASLMTDCALSGRTMSEYVTILASLSAEDADKAMQTLFLPGHMSVMHILPDGSAQ